MTLGFALMPTLVNATVRGIFQKQEAFKVTPKKEKGKEKMVSKIILVFLIASLVVAEVTSKSIENFHKRNSFNSSTRLAPIWRNYFKQCLHEI